MTDAWVVEQALHVYWLSGPKPPFVLRSEFERAIEEAREEARRSLEAGRAPEPLPLKKRKRSQPPNGAESEPS